MAKQMYPAMINSPQTELAADITATDTTITVLDASVLPDAHNLIVIGSDENAETILYRGKSGNDLTDCIRGFQGAARAWPAGSKCARNYTAYDHDAARENIETAQQTANVAQTAADAAQQTADSANTSLTSHANATTAHGATANATPNRIPIRDADGQFNVNPPTDGWHVARKAEVDAVQANLNTHANNTTVHITAAERTAWNAKETPAGAQDKANTAEQNAKNASLPRTGGTVTGVITAPQIRLNNGTILRDENYRSVINAANDRFDVLTTDGQNFIFRVIYADGVIQFKGQNVYHSGNFDPNSKVNKTGDTMTGKLTAAGLESSSSNIVINPNSSSTNTLIWFTNNGANRGLVYHDVAINAICMRTYHPSDSTQYSQLAGRFDGDLTWRNSPVWTNINNAASKTQNGHLPLANGMILQWGLAKNVPYSGEIMYPIAFPNQPLTVVANANGSGVSTSIGVITQVSGTILKNKFGIQTSSDASLDVSWFALGY